MININDILLLHEYSIADYGGGSGVRDMESIKASIERPFQTFDGKELYTDALNKAAAIAESIIANHPFVDGNKRTGMLAMVAILMESNIHIAASGDDLYELIIAIASGRFLFDDILNWLKENTFTKQMID